MVGSSGGGPGRAVLSTQCVRAARWPVMKLMREATHTGVEAHALVKRTPEAAMASMAGVRRIGLPAHPMASARC